MQVSETRIDAGPIEHPVPGISRTPSITTARLARAHEALMELDRLLAGTEHDPAAAPPQERAIELCTNARASIGEVLRHPALATAPVQAHARSADAVLIEAEDELRAWQAGLPAESIVRQQVAEALAHVRMAIAASVNEP